MDRSKTDIQVTKDVTGYTLFVKQETDVSKELYESEVLRQLDRDGMLKNANLKHAAHWPPEIITQYIQTNNLTVAEFEAERGKHLNIMRADPDLQGFVIRPLLTRRF
jgi:hypothetical protein